MSLPQTVFFLCSRSDFTRERLGYLHAFGRRGTRVLCLDDAPGAGRDLGAIAAAGLTPDLILHPDSGTIVIPAGLETSPIPTACFQIDSFFGASHRRRWSLLFDRALIFHADDLEYYRAAGHPDVVPLFHSADVDNRREVDQVRDLEVAIVARTSGHYRLRRRCLEALAGQVRMNEWQKSYQPSEVEALYGRAKIVLNVGRDDFRRDVGVRFGEAMVAGALFATILPTELTSMGFVEGRDFIGFHGPDDVARICRTYLDDDAARRRIAGSGQARVLSEHTYDHRAARLVESLSARTAPARRWGRDQVALTRLDYFATKGMLPEAYAELRAIGLTAGPVSARAMVRFGLAAGRQALRRTTMRY